MHVEVDAGAIKRDFDSKRHGQLDVALHVEHGEEAVVDELVDYDDVGDGRAAAHQQRDVRVPQDALHHDFVLNFRQQLVSDARVKNFLDRHWCAVQ